MAKVVRGSDQFQIRLPEGMRERIRTEADTNGRSMNAEIVHRLEDSFTSWPRVDLPHDVMERAARFYPEQRAHFEKRLNKIAIDIAEEEFPAEADSFLALFSAYHSLTSSASAEKKVELADELREFLVKTVQQLPDNVRQTAMQDISDALAISKAKRK